MLFLLISEKEFLHEINPDGITSFKGIHATQLNQSNSESVSNKILNILEFNNFHDCHKISKDAKQNIFKYFRKILEETITKIYRFPE